MPVTSFATTGLLDLLNLGSIFPSCVALMGDEWSANGQFGFLL